MYNAYTILTVIQQAEFFSLLKTGVLLATGFYGARLSSRASSRMLNNHASSQQIMVFKKVIYFSVLMIFIVAAFQQLGFKLSVLLGSAGIATAAIAIASQTSISNIVSGLFLIMEKSFQIGDRIKVGSTTGVITSIDLLSVKLLSANNTLIRIPNEFLIKSEITNMTRFEARRLDLNLKVSSEEDISNVKTILLQQVKNNAMSLSSPPPSVSVNDIDHVEINLQLSVWTNQNNYDNLKDSLLQKIHLAFKENNISM